MEWRYSGRRSRGTGKDGRIRNPPSKNQCERSINATKRRRTHFPNTRWYSKIVRDEITNSENPLLRQHRLVWERRPQRRASRRFGKDFQPTGTDLDKNFRTSWHRETVCEVQSQMLSSMCRRKKHSLFH